MLSLQKEKQVENKLEGFLSVLKARTLYIFFHTIILTEFSVCFYRIQHICNLSYFADCILILPQILADTESLPAVFSTETGLCLACVRQQHPVGSLCAFTKFQLMPFYSVQVDCKRQSQISLRFLIFYHFHLEIGCYVEDYGVLRKFPIDKFSVTARLCCYSADVAVNKMQKKITINCLMKEFFLLHFAW